MAQMTAPAPLSLSGDVASDWKRFKSQWEFYELATDLDEKPPAKRAASFLTCIGREAHEVFMTLDITKEESRNVVNIIEAFDKYFIGKVNVTFERYNFNCRNQEPGESFDVYLNDLRKLIKSCNFGELANSLLTDRIILGIRSDSTRRKLLEIRDLSLEKAIDICKSNESTSKQMKQLSSSNEMHVSDDVNFLRKSSRPSGGPQSRTRVPTPPRTRYKDNLSSRSNLASRPTK